MVPTTAELKSVFPDAVIDPSEHSAKVCCPYHSDKTPSFIILLKDKGKWKAGMCHCFGCGVTKNWKTVLKDQGYEVQEDPISRVTQLRERLQIQNKHIPVKQETIVTPLVTNSLVGKPKKEFPYKFSPYLKGRGIGELVQEQFKVYDKPSEHRVYMPVFDEEGRYKYFNARSTESKAFFIEEAIDKSLGCIEEIDFSKPIAICESQIDAYSLWQLGLQAVATLGSANSNSLKVLKKSTSIFILCYDNDTAGRLATEKAREVLGSYRCLSLQWDEDSEFKDVNNVLVGLGEEFGKSYLNSIIS